MPYYAVIDTNVLVSAMLKWNSVPGNVVSFAFDGTIIPVFNSSILKEYREVLARPKQLDASIEIQEEVVRKNNTLRLGIYEDLRAGLLDRSEYESLKKELAERIDEATAAIEKLNKEKREILDGVSKQQSWVEQFRQYENVTELTRPMVIHLIERINIFEDSNIEIVFRHRNQIEEILQFISEKTANKKLLAMPIREVG